MMNTPPTTPKKPSKESFVWIVIGLTTLSLLMMWPSRKTDLSADKTPTSPVQSAGGTAAPVTEHTPVQTAALPAQQAPAFTQPAPSNSKQERAPAALEKKTDEKTVPAATAPHAANAP